VSRLPGDTAPVLRFLARVELSGGGWYLIFIPDFAIQSPFHPPSSYASSGLGSGASRVAAPRRWLLGGVTARRYRPGSGESRSLPAGTQAFGHSCSMPPPSFLRQWANPRGWKSSKLRKGLHAPK